MKQWDTVGSLKASISPQTSVKANKEQGEKTQLSDILSKWGIDNTS